MLLRSIYKTVFYLRILRWPRRPVKVAWMIRSQTRPELDHSGWIFKPGLNRACGSETHTCHLKVTWLQRKVSSSTSPDFMTGRQRCNFTRPNNSRVWPLSASVHLKQTRPTLKASSGCQHTLMPGERSLRVVFSFPSRSHTLFFKRNKIKINSKTQDL